jgi:tRNA modification GTPase
VTGTIFALSSGRPPAAISVIRLSGAGAHEAAALMAGSLPEPRTAAVRELRHPRSGGLLDEAVVLRFDSPASSTGEDIVEFQCHGGRAVVDAVLAALASLDGLRSAEPGEFTRRAFENGRIDLTEAEGLADLLEAETESQRKAALALAEGGLRAAIARWQEQLLALAAQAERAIDYDEMDEGVDPAMVRGCAELAGELQAWLERPRIERLRDGVRIVIAGPPNVGKSSCLNAITGEERAIVSNVPGTTRDHIEAPLSVGGMPVLITDTAGLRDSLDPVEAAGVERANRLVSAADILLWLGEPERAPPHERILFVHSKADLPERAVAPVGSLPVSAVTGQGVGQLLEAIRDAAGSLLPTEGVVAINRRQAAELECAADALVRAATHCDVILIAEDLRAARAAFDRISGRAGVEDMLDALFGRFCLGK